MAYNISITANSEVYSTNYKSLDELFQAVKQLESFYGDHNLVAVSDDPFVGVKFKDIQKISVSGISRTELRKYAQEKLAKEQAERMAAYHANQGNSGALGSAIMQAESVGTRLI